jgi:hypothetical protein
VATNAIGWKLFPAMFPASLAGNPCSASIVVGLWGPATATKGADNSSTNHLTYEPIDSPERYHGYAQQY